MNFSVVLIAKNEAKTLPRLLESLKEFREKGGEVVLIDTGSTDGTADTARSYGCNVEEVGTRFLKVIDKETAESINNFFIIENEAGVVKEGDTLFDYSSARNYAASLASNDFVFMPDCDEIYTKFDIDKLQEVIKSGVEQLEYQFVFAHDQFGNPTVEFMHCKAYNRTKLKWVGIIHEVLSGSAKRQYLPVDVIKLEHYQNHETNRSGYLRGLALDCFLHKENDRNSHYFARELYWNNRPHSAIKEFKRHIAMNGWQPERSQSAIFIGDCYLMIGDESEAINWYHKAYDIESNRREPLIRLAEFYWKKGDYRRVAAYASAALTIKQDGFYANNAEHYRHIPHELLYWAYWYLGEKDKAKEHFDKAFEFCPKNPKFIREYSFFYDLPSVSILLPSLGRPEGLKRALESIDRIIYPKDKVELLKIVDSEDTVPNKVDQMYKQSTGEWIVYASNDIEFTPDSLLTAILFAKKYNKRLVAFNTGTVLSDEGNICEHFIIHRSLVNEIGQIFDTRFHHVGVDNLLWAKAKKTNDAIRCDDAVVIHYHFSNKKAVYDDTYVKGWSHVDQDRALLKEELAKLSDNRVV